MMEVERENVREKIKVAIKNLGYDSRDAQSILSELENGGYVRITQPYIDEPKYQKVIMNATRNGYENGRSYKLGNIIINVKESMKAKLGLAAVGLELVAIADGVLAGELLGTVSAVVGALISGAGLVEKNLSNEAALVLAVLWQHRFDYGGNITVEKSYSLVNERIEAYGKQTLSIDGYRDVLKELENAKCMFNENGLISLREVVCFEYSE